MRPRLSSAVLLLLLTLLPACTLHRPLTHHAVAYNKTVEEAQNRMLFLNIIRASQRRPMYFTGIGSITASPSYSLAVGGGNLSENIATKIATTTDKDGAGVTNELTDTDSGTFTLPSGALANEPTLQIGVLDTQDFMTGILSPVSIEVVRHYLASGWPPDLLAYLLVERIEAARDADFLQKLDEDCSKPFFSESQGDLVILENDPNHEDRFDCFEQAIENLQPTGIHCQLRPHKEHELIFSLDGEPDLAEVIGANQEGFLLERETPGKDQKIQVRKQDTSWDLHCKSTMKDEAFDAYIGAPSLREAEQKRQESKESEVQYAEDSGPSRIALILRSPHGVLYYLGEILRQIVDNKDFGIPEVQLDDKTVKLFWVNTNSGACTSEVAVSYRGKNYFIPSNGSGENCPANGSMRSLALASQLLSLHKSAKDLPGTTLVRVVGN